MTEGQREVRMVGPIIRGMDIELADAIAAAATIDNPGTEIQVIDTRGYVRIQAPTRCRLTRPTLERELGRPCPLPQIEPDLSGFAGRMKVTDDEVVWYLERED
jgi:toluene monooxygenase system protein D